MKNIKIENTDIKAQKIKNILSKGTLFQQKVWGEIRKIPIGKTRTYKSIAISIGRPNASRAVGHACKKNPFPIIIPCHRVVRSDGCIGGYIYGKKMKNKLLENEKSGLSKNNLIKLNFYFTDP